MGWRTSSGGGDRPVAQIIIDADGRDGHLERRYREAHGALYTGAASGLSSPPSPIRCFFKKQRAAGPFPAVSRMEGETGPKTTWERRYAVRIPDPLAGNEARWPSSSRSARPATRPGQRLTIVGVAVQAAPSQ